MPSQRRPKRRFSSASLSRVWGNNGAATRGRLPRGESSPSVPTPRDYAYSPSHADIDDHSTDFEQEIHLCDDITRTDTEGARLTYASLPPTPITATPPPRSPSPTRTVVTTEDLDAVPFSLWDYLREELLATDFDSHQELKWHRVSNFLNVPLAVEKIVLFGFILCLDSFLYVFTVLPIRAFLALYRLLIAVLFQKLGRYPPASKADLLRALLLVISVVACYPLIDASRIYHAIRGQDTIKLYVIFNALEVADRLCASIGQDILDCLFSRSTLERFSHPLRPIMFFSFAVLYTIAHALVMTYQLLSLHVAVNSYDQALLTLLVSNQFVEIKGSVFKKFEKDNLFQITCADIVERFTLSLMLSVVAFRNLVELAGASFELNDLPASWSPSTLFGGRTKSIAWTISYPVITVLLSEMGVDWLKHAFITKFNHIRPTVFERYTDVLCRDLVASTPARRGRKHTYVDQSPLVARRLGFSPVPLAVVSVLIGAQSLLPLIRGNEREWDEDWDVDGVLMRRAKWIAVSIVLWMCLVVVKIMMGVNLVSYAIRRRAGMEAREAEDVVNDFGRDPIGEGKEERMYNRELKTLLTSPRDDAESTAEIGERKDARGQAKGGGSGSGGKKKVKLEDLTRFTMVKRIW